MCQCRWGTDFLLEITLWMYLADLLSAMPPYKKEFKQFLAPDHSGLGLEGLEARLQQFRVIEVLHVMALFLENVWQCRNVWQHHAGLSMTPWWLIQNWTEWPKRVLARHGRECRDTSFLGMVTFSTDSDAFWQMPLIGWRPSAWSGIYAMGLWKDHELWLCSVNNGTLGTTLICNSTMSGYNNVQCTWLLLLASVISMWSTRVTTKRCTDWEPWVRSREWNLVSMIMWRLF